MFNIILGSLLGMLIVFVYCYIIVKYFNDIFSGWLGRLVDIINKFFGFVIVKMMDWSIIVFK